MAHRQIAKLKSDNLSSIAYEYNGVVLDGIKVFRVKLSNAKIIPAALDNKFSTIANMNPLGRAELASKVMAKTNAATLNEKAGAGFYGIFYADKKLFCSGRRIESAAQAANSKATLETGRGIPHICFKSDGTVLLRWFAGTNELAQAYPACDVIIAGAHPLVSEGKSVFDTAVYSRGMRIANGKDLNDKKCRFDNTITEGSASTPHARTMLGVSTDSNQKAKEAFMVVTDGDAPMNIFTAAHLMQDLGCDVAINLDGGSASQMRVAAGYTNGMVPGKVTQIGNDKKLYGSAVCAVRN